LDDSGAVTSVAPDRFRDQLSRLEDSGCHFVSLDRIVGWLAGEDDLPPAPLALTFDDGDASVARVAAPELARRGIPATLFVPTGWCLQQAALAAGGRRRFLDAAAIQDLHRTGWTIGAHGVRHLHMAALDPGEARQELADSRAHLEALLGEPVRYFAWPFGEWSPSLLQTAREFFEAACGTSLALVERSSDRFALPRIDAFYLEGLLGFGGPHGRAGRLYLRVRRGLRRLRRWRPEEVRAA
jgi:peptidoglycan/xylan/chitin deacetylase (PgdA/CDA1 family)